MENAKTDWEVRQLAERQIAELLEKDQSIQEKIRKIREDADRKVKELREEAEKKAREELDKQNEYFQSLRERGVEKLLKRYLFSELNFGSKPLNFATLAKRFIPDENKELNIKFVSRLIDELVDQEDIEVKYNHYSIGYPKDIPVYKGGKVTMELEYKGVARVFEITHSYESIFEGKMHVPFGRDDGEEYIRTFELDFNNGRSLWEYSSSGTRWDGKEDEDSDC